MLYPLSYGGVPSSADGPAKSRSARGRSLPETVPAPGHGDNDRTDRRRPSTGRRTSTRKDPATLLAFSVAPSGTGRADASVSDAVAEAVRVVRDSGLPNRTSSMFTRIVDLGHGSLIRPAGI